jgi:AcrR family transcriptional regulator
MAKDKRETILQAALELIAERGFHGAPMSAVAERASVSAGIIYHYFTNKDDLIHALYREVEAKFSRALLAGHPQSLPVAEAFQRIWLNAYQFYRSYPHEARFLEQYKHSPFYQLPPVDSLQGSDLAFIAQLFEGDAAERPLKDLPPDVIYELTLGAAARVAQRRPDDSGVLNEQQLAAIAAACWQAVAR